MDFDGERWARRRGVRPFGTCTRSWHRHDFGVRFRDLDGDGVCELIVSGHRPERGSTGGARRSTVGRAALPASGRCAARRQPRATTPACASSTSTRTATTTWSSPTRRTTALYLFDSIEKGWSRSREGRPGEPTRTPCRRSCADGTNNGFWFHSRHPVVAERGHGRPARPRGSPLVQRLLTDVEPDRPQSPEASLRSIRVAAGVSGRAGGGRAAGGRPDRLRLGGRRQALGRRDGRLPARRRRQGQARRAGQVPRRHQRRRPVRQGHRLPRRPRLPDRRPALAQGRARRLRPGHLLRRGPRRRRQGRHREVLFTGFPRATSSTASTASIWASTTGSTAPTATAAGTVRSVKTGAGRRASAAATSGSGPTRRVRDRDRPDQYGRTATTGATGSATTTATRPGTTSWPTTTSAATRTSPRPTAQVQVSLDARRRAGLPGQPDARPVQRPRRGQPLHLGQQRHRLPRRPVRPRLRRQHCSSASRSTTWSTARSSTPDGRDLHQPPGRGRADVGVPGLERQLVPARRCSRPAPTARSGSPTCTAR